MWMISLCDFPEFFEWGVPRDGVIRNLLYVFSYGFLKGSWRKKRHFPAPLYLPSIRKPIISILLEAAFSETWIHFSTLRDFQSLSGTSPNVFGKKSGKLVSTDLLRKVFSQKTLAKPKNFTPWKEKTSKSCWIFQVFAVWALWNLQFWVWETQHAPRGGSAHLLASHGFPTQKTAGTHTPTCWSQYPKHQVHILWCHVSLLQRAKLF